jgi:polysaccharide export outer membrane protein
MIKGTIRWMLFLLIGSFIISCAPTKQSAYFRKNKNISSYDAPDRSYTVKYTETDIIRIGDNLFITVSSGNDEPTSFNQPTGLPMTDLELLSYQVDDEGMIRLPYLKKVKAAGLSFSELTDTLEYRLSQYIYLPAVSVRVVNQRITVLGEVNNPGIFVFNRNNINIYQAIAEAGDIAPFGNRKKVLIVRQSGAEIMKKYIDLTDEDIVNSTWFYVQPDDIVYIEPLLRKNLGMETFSVFDVLGLFTSSYLIYTIISGL